MVERDGDDELLSQQRDGLQRVVPHRQDHEGDVERALLEFRDEVAGTGLVNHEVNTGEARMELRERGREKRDGERWGRTDREARVAVGEPRTSAVAPSTREERLPRRGSRRPCGATFPSSDGPRIRDSPRVPIAATPGLRRAYRRGFGEWRSSRLPRIPELVSSSFIRTLSRDRP